MKKQISSKSYFQTLNMIYFAQMMMMLAFTGVIAFMLQSGTAGESNEMWSIVIPLVIIVSLTLGYMVFRMMVGKIKAEEPLKQKMPKYSRAVLIRSALLEMPALLAAIVAFMTGQMYYLGVPLFIVLIFLMLRPTRNAVAQDLNLSSKDRALLDNPEAIISEAEQGL